MFSVNHGQWNCGNSLCEWILCQVDSTFYSLNISFNTNKDLCLYAMNNGECESDCQNSTASVNASPVCTNINECTMKNGRCEGDFHNTALCQLHPLLSVQISTSAPRTTEGVRGTFIEQHCASYTLFCLYRYQRVHQEQRRV